MSLDATGRPARAWPPKPQRLYVNPETGEIGIFDHWAKWPRVGAYQLSSGQVVRARPDGMRLATAAEAAEYARAKRAGVEAMARG